MEAIFHEKQQGSLCAQHCLNALLQGAYFTPVDLATLAQRMDEEERMRMAESGVDTDDYQKFIQQPSGNMDDSGYFSVQVISSALEVWGLELVPYNSSEPLATQAQQQPENMVAYICNYRDHWFTIRKLGHQWFNLNSLLSGPQLISTTYLSIFLAQLQQEGYSIFVVRGGLPPCSADDLLKVTPAVQISRPSIKIRSPSETELQKAIKLSLGETVNEEEENDFQEAIKLSLAEQGPDPCLDKAIEMSLQLNAAAGTTAACTPQAGENSRTCVNQSPDGLDDEEELAAAMRLSLEAEVLSSPTKAEAQEIEESCNEQTAGHRPTTTPTIPTSSCTECVDPEEVRKRRLAYLERKAITTNKTNAEVASNR
uniref:ubiquitinyl hydrolase 1 n=1 Tax=Panstrongylus megistus TaxID=65343 RepID=A0A069DSG0_9HEMI